MDQKPSVGRIVHYRPANDYGKGQPYPAIITHVFGDTCVNLEVFDHDAPITEGQGRYPTSVTLGEGLRSFQWPPRV